MPTPDIIPLAGAIASNDPRLQDYAHLTDANVREDEFSGRSGRFIAEGELVVRALLASGYKTRSLLVAQGKLESLADALDHLPEATPIFVGSHQELQTLAGFPFHRGVLASGERPAPHPWRPLAHSASALIILERLANIDNVGAAFRIAAALAPPGAAVLLTPGCCDPLYRKSLRVSMGHALRVPFARIEPWPDSLPDLAAMGYTTLALTPAPDARDIRGLSAAAPRPALLMGSEGPGLSDAAMRGAMVRARIGMNPGVDSLNVSVALAVALHELRALQGSTEPNTP